MALSFYPKYVVDACVMLAYLDEDEPHHQEALAFFKELDQFTQAGNQPSIVVPAHSYLEINLNIEKKKQEVAAGTRSKYASRQGTESFNWEGYPITLEFMAQIEDRGLYDKFGTKLRPGDFIYAALAYIEDYPLVTLDNDFAKVAPDINLISLLP